MKDEHKWDLVDAVGRSPLLGRARIKRGIELAEIERRLLTADELSASERERLLGAVRELAEVYAGLGPR